MPLKSIFFFCVLTVLRLTSPYTHLHRYMNKKTKLSHILIIMIQ